jgi:hypothetical protein
MDVRRYRQTGFAADFGEHPQSVFEARTAVAVNTRAIGLVETGFEDNLQPMLIPELRQSPGSG